MSQTTVPLEQELSGGRPPKIHGRKYTWEEVHDYILKIVPQDRPFSKVELGGLIGKGSKQAGRIADKMIQLNLLNRTASRKLQIPNIMLNEEQAQFAKLKQDAFAQIKEISQWFGNLSCDPRTAGGYKSTLKQMFDKLETHPSSVIVSKQSFVEFWKQFKIVNDEERGEGHDHEFRIAYRSFGDEFEYHVNLALGTKIGLTSGHDSYKKYAGAAISAKTSQKIGKMMLQDGEIELYTWFRTGLRTGARSGAIATMSWNNIVLNEENFQVGQHETKDKRNDFHLGRNGELQIKEPPVDLLKVLKFWKDNELSPSSKFVWFEDTGNDAANRNEAQKVRTRIIPKLREYFQKFYDEMDILTRTYAEIEPGHLLRHSAAQLLKEEGATVEEIMHAFKWKSAETVTWYVAASKKEKANVKKLQNQVDSFSDEEAKHMEGI